MRQDKDKSQINKLKIDEKKIDGDSNKLKKD